METVYNAIPDSTIVLLKHKGYLNRPIKSRYEIKHYLQDFVAFVHVLTSIPYH